jgi:hypothetical protein
MAKSKKDSDTNNISEQHDEKKIPTIHDPEWTEYVLAMLNDDEKIAENPTTDGLRRIFELALNCRVLSSLSKVAQSPDMNNEKRATVVHSITYYLNAGDPDSPHLNTITVDGSADVYWGNCDKIFRNHPVAVAETRAEGRALRRALRLRKVVAAEELAKDIEDHPDHDTVNKITNNQINFIDVLAKRLDVNVSKLLEKLALNSSNVYNIGHEDAVNIVQTLTTYQQTNNTPSELTGYNSDWK